jgi:HD-GYP domain-containing protein (c-di-GMP phosphodiesterase class II)
VVGRALAWFRERLGKDGKPAARASRNERSDRDATKAWLPTDIKLVEYAEIRAVEAELPRARTAFTRSEDVLKAVVSDVKVGKIPQVAEVASAVDEMVDSMIDNPDALMWVGRLRDEDVNTYNHGVKVALYLIALGRQLGFPKKELANLGMIGMLADVGKIKLPRALLDKPGMLAPSEFGLIKEHVRLGLESIREGGTIPLEVEKGIAQHHERLDGTGYPNGLKGNEISIYGRMAAIADSFAALITPRTYANASAPQDALMNLYEWAGSSFHEPLVEQFVQAVGVFPVGSLVELTSGEVAVVVAHNRVRRLEPRVLVLTWPDKAPLSKPIERDLLTQSGGGAGRLRIVKGLAAGAYGLRMRDYYMGEIARANGLAA